MVGALRLCKSGANEITNRLNRFYLLKKRLVSHSISTFSFHGGVFGLGLDVAWVEVIFWKPVIIFEFKMGSHVSVGCCYFYFFRFGFIYTRIAGCSLCTSPTYSGRMSGVAFIYIFFYAEHILYLKCDRILEKKNVSQIVDGARPQTAFRKPGKKQNYLPFQSDRDSSYTNFIHARVRLCELRNIVI